MKTALRIIGILLAVIMLVIAAGVVAVQSPKVQEKIGRRVVEKLGDKTDADITFSSLSIRIPEAIVLKDVVVKDKAPRVEGADTLATIGLLSAKFSVKGLMDGHGAYISHASLKDASFTLAEEPSDSGTVSNYIRMLRIHESESGSSGWGNILSAGCVDIRNFRFTLLNPTVETNVGPGQIDWCNLHTSIHRLKVRHLKVKDSYVHAVVDTLSLTETRTGFDIRHAEGKVRVGKERIKIENLKLEETASSIRMNRLQIDGPISNYSDFTDKIKITAEVRKGSIIDMSSISYFGEGIDRMTFRAWIDGKVKGYVNDFEADCLHFREMGSGVEGTFSGTVMDIPHIQKSLLGLKVKNLSFTMDGIARFVRSVSPDTDIDLQKIAKGERFTYKGTVKGPLNRLAVNGKVSSGIGSLDAGITLRNTIDELRPLILGGNIKTHDLDLGSIIGTKDLGALSMETDLQATLAGSGMSLDTVSLKVSRLNALGYDYTNISAAGKYLGSAFDGRFVSRDPNLDFLFQGIFNLSPRTRNAVYRFYANLSYADLHALHIDSREKSKMWFTAYSDFLRTEEGELLGDVTVTDMSLESETGYHDIGRIAIRSHTNENVNRIQLISNFLDGSFVGEKNILSFANDIRALTVDRSLPSLLENHSKPWENTA